MAYGEQKVKLPPGATLIEEESNIKLPKGATLISSVEKKNPSVTGGTTSQDGDGATPSTTSTTKQESVFGNQYPTVPKKETPTEQVPEYNTGLSSRKKRVKSVRDILVLNQTSAQPKKDESQVQKPITDVDVEKELKRTETRKKNMEIAIDNTTEKALKLKGINAAKGTPLYEEQRNLILKKTKPTMVGDVVVSPADVVYATDKDGKPGLSNTINWWEDLTKGWDEAINGEDEARAFDAMSTEEKVAHANQVEAEKPPTEYVSEHSGVIGGGAHTLAAAAPFLAKAAGGAAIGAMTGGTGAPLIMAMAATAPDMINQGMKDETLARYYQLKKENPNVDDITLMKKAEEGKISGGIQGAAENLLFIGTGLKAPLSNEVKQVLGKNIVKSLESSAHVGAVTGAVKGAGLAERAAEGYHIDAEDAINESVGTALDNFTGMLALNGLIHGVTGLVKVPKNVMSAYKYALKDTPIEEVRDVLALNEQAGKLPEGTTEKVTQDIQGYNNALSKTAEGLTPETQSAVAGLIQKRDNVVAEMATKDVTQQPLYEEKIKALNEQIKNITESNDPIKYEVDEVTGQPLSEKLLNEQPSSTTVSSAGVSGSALKDESGGFNPGVIKRPSVLNTEQAADRWVEGNVQNETGQKRIDRLNELTELINNDKRISDADKKLSLDAINRALQKAKAPTQYTEAATPKPTVSSGEGSVGVGGDVETTTNVLNETQKSNPTVWQKIKDAFNNLVSKTKEYLNKAKGTQYEELAKVLGDHLKNVRTSTIEDLRGVLGEKIGGQLQKLHILVNGGKGDLQIFFHEAMHHITFEKISQYLNNNHENLKPHEIDAIQNLQRIFEDSKAKIAAMKIKTSAHYGFTNLHEFISEAFSNPEFQRLLKELPSEGKSPTVFKAFLDAIAKLMGLKDATILNDIFHHTEKLLDKPKSENEGIAELYHQAKAEGTHPDFVKAVEQSLKEQHKAETPQNKPTVSSGAGSVGVGGDVETKQQIENFGVNKADVEPVHSVISQVFNGLKKAGLTAAKTVGDWVGIGKGSEKPYSLKIGDKEVQVKNTQPEVVNGFYSPLEKVITESKFDKLPAKQWAEKYANSEEAKWTGLKDWLAQQQGSVSKADIQQYLKDNRIQVVEVTKSNEYELKEISKEDAKSAKYRAHELYDENGNSLYSNELIDKSNKVFARPTEASQPTKYSQYQEAGDKENYKEVLVTLPSRNVFDKNKVEIKKNYQSATQGTFDVYYNGELLAKGYDLFSAGTGEYGQKTEEQLNLFAKNLYEKGDKYNKIENKQGNFKSSHFDEPNILVHLRMNTRTDAEGNKVLFLEEVQSDWGQKGKREGFKELPKYKESDFDYSEPTRYLTGNDGIRSEVKAKEWESKDGNYRVTYNPKIDQYVVNSTRVQNAHFDSLKEAIDNINTPREYDKLTPSAPFVTDTNAWTKLGLKYALRHAVEEGATKLAWTTGEQQNERYDLSKQVDKIDVEAVEDVDNLFFVDIKLSNGTTENLEVENGIIREGSYKGQRLDNVIGKDYADKILSTPKGKSKTLEGNDLKVGGKGMKGFYGSPKEGSLGIVGNVAKSLFKQEPKTVKINSGGELDFTKQTPIGEDLKRVPQTEQHSIDITPEMKAEVEGKGQPLFKDAEAQYRIESGKNIIEAIKDFNESKNKSRATVALTHEIMHPTVVSIIDGAKEGNEVGVKHTKTIVDEFNKANPNNKVTFEDLIKGNDAFKDGTTSKQYRQVQEFIAKAWEKYHTEGGKGFSEAFQKVLDQITKAFQSVYKSITGKQLTPELKQMFDDILGKEQSIKETPKSENKPIQNESKVNEVQQSAEVKEPATTEPNKEIESASEGTGGKPPRVDATVEFTGEEPKKGITHEAMAETRETVGLPEYEGKEVEGHTKLIEEAKEQVKNTPNLVEDTLKKFENNEKVTNKDNAVMAVYKSALDHELATNPTKETFDKVRRLAKILDPAGSEAGKLLESRKLFSEGDTLSDFLLDKEAAQGFPLNEKQIKEKTIQHKELVKAKKELEESVKKEQEEDSRLVAEKGFNKAKAEKKKTAKKTHEEYVAERKQAIEDARQALKDLRSGEKGLSAVAVPGLRELKAITPHIKKAVESYINEGVDKLDNVVNSIHAEFKDVLEGITKKDIHDIIAGKHDEKRQTQAEKNSELRLLKREAELLDKIQREKLGESTAKTERKRNDASRRIEELKKRLEEVRKINKDRKYLEGKETEEGTVQDRTATDSYDNKELQKKLNKRINELNSDLKNKKYAQPKPPQRPFVLSRKSQLLKDRVIQLEKKIAEERYLDQRAKMGKWEKAWDKFQNIAGFRRLLQTTLDASIWLRQLGSLALNPRKWDVAGKFIAAGAKAAFNQIKYDRIMDAIHKSEDFKHSLEDGLRFNELDAIHPSQQNEFFPKSWLYSIPIVRGGLKASQRIADASLNVARYELYQKYKKNLQREGVTRASDPEVYKEMAKWVMNSTGSGNLLSALENKKAEKLLGATFYGARLMASNFNQLNPLYYAKMPKEVRSMAWKDVASYTGTIIATGLGLAAAGGKISFDPDKPDFLQVRFGDKVYDITGGKAAYIRTFLRWVEAGYARIFKSKHEADKALEFAASSTARFWRNKLAPNTGYLVNAVTGKNSMGEDFDWKDIYQEAMPLYADDAWNAAEKDGYTSFFTVLLPNLLGLGYASYYSDAEMKPIEETLKRNMRSDEMDLNEYRNYKKGGTELTDEEKDDFADKRDEKIKERIEKLYEGTDTQNKLLVNNKVVTKKYSEMTKEQIITATNNIKKEITSDLKKELFGEKKTTREERRAQIKLKKEREKINN